MTQRRVGGLVFLGLLLLAAFGVAAITPVSVSSGVGEKTERPTTVTALDSSYELGIGDLELDLSDVTLPAGTTSVDASVGIGKLVVTVPEDVALVIDAHAGVGSIDLLGARDDGVDADRTLSAARLDAGCSRARPRGRRRRSATSRFSAGELDAVPAAARRSLACGARRARERSRASAPGSRSSLRVDATLVRLTFALLAFAGGAGIVAYGGAWLALAPESGPAPSPTRRLLGYVALAIAGAIALRGFGFSDSLIWPAALCGAGILLARGRSGASVVAGLSLVAVGVIVFVDQNATSDGRDAAFQSSAVAIALLLVLGPWAWRLAAERDAERIARIRSEERAEMAARVHDSVLQTLALVQREANDPRRVAALARRQERELRGWLYPDARSDGASLASAIDDGRRRGRGAARRPGRARPHRRRAARRPRRGARARGPRGDGERRRALRRRPGLGLRRRRRRRDRGLRPRPRQRLRPGRAAAGRARDRRVDPRPHGARRRHRGDRRPRRRAPRSSCVWGGSREPPPRRARRRPRPLPRGRSRASSARPSRSSARPARSPRPCR